MPTDRSAGRIRRNAGTALIAISSILLLASGAAKLAHVPPVVAQLAANGFDGSKITTVGFLELFSALLFLIPATRSAGLLLVSAFLGGAIATHFQHSQSVVPPSIVLLLIWLAAWLRHPEILWSRSRTRSGLQSSASVSHIAAGV